MCENRIKKCIKNRKTKQKLGGGIRTSNRADEYDQSTLYTIYQHGNITVKLLCTINIHYVWAGGVAQW
jgi:phosphoribosylformimino-5-aminoimidazole carboxamide ribonucleotide (ProFAR) isomerase